MRKLPLVLFFVGAAMFATGAEQVAVNYCPLKEGVKWYYRTDTPGQTADTVMIQVVSTEKSAKMLLFRMETTKQGKVVAHEYLSSDERGVFRHSHGEAKATKPVCLIKYPVTPGETWQDETEFAGQKLKMSYKVGKEEEVQVPAGKFKAVPVSVESIADGKKITSTNWFAANVGIVKQSAESDGKKRTTELVKREQAK